MSYDISLEHNGVVTKSKNIIAEGGTQIVGGTNKCELNITYNYSKIYSKFNFSLKDLNGNSGKDTKDILFNLISTLGINRDDDYWKPTNGNAGYALNILMGWAKEFPEAIWIVL